MESLNQAVDQTIQYQNTTMWIMFVLFVVAPLMLVLIAVPIAVAAQRKLKCPKCSNWRHNKTSGVQTVSNIEQGKATIVTKDVIVCRKCKNEFSI